MSSRANPADSPSDGGTNANNAGLQGESSTASGGESTAVTNGCRYYTENPKVESVVSDYKSYRVWQHMVDGDTQTEAEGKMEGELRIMGLFDDPTFPEGTGRSHKVLVTMPPGAALEYGKAYCEEFASAFLGTEESEWRTKALDSAGSTLADALHLCSGLQQGIEPMGMESDPDLAKRFVSLLRRTVCAS